MRGWSIAEGKALRRSTVVAAADRFIGMRIRECRTMLGLSQRQLGQLIGVTYQQAHKYEHGINAVSAGRLYVIARALSIPLEYFFEGIEQDESQLPPRQRLIYEVMRNFGEVQNVKHLEAAVELTRALAGR
jgi:transcriptional regulator with XRE-family HTH domain